MHWLKELKNRGINSINELMPVGDLQNALNELPDEVANELNDSKEEFVTHKNFLENQYHENVTRLSTLQHQETKLLELQERIRLAVLETRAMIRATKQTVDIISDTNILTKSIDLGKLSND